MTYVCIAMALHWLYNIYKSISLDMIRWNEVFIPTKEPKIEIEVKPEEPPEIVPPEKLKLGNVFEYLEGSKRAKVKRIRG